MRKKKKKRKRKKCLSLGEKMIGTGFMTVLIFGSGLDGPNWIFPLSMVGVGVAVMETGNIIAKKEGSEYV